MLPFLLKKRKREKEVEEEALWPVSTVMLPRRCSQQQNCFWDLGFCKCMVCDLKLAEIIIVLTFKALFIARMVLSDLTRF